MWCAVGMVCTLASLVAAARYDDYSGAKMPQYGAAGLDYEGPRDSLHSSPDEYHDQGQDVPAPQEYEEDIGKNTKYITKDFEDSEIFHKKVKKRRPVIADFNSHGFEKYNSNEEVPIAPEKLTIQKRRSRNRMGNLEKYRNGKNEFKRDFHDYDSHEENTEFDVKNSKFNKDTTPIRVIRRKPRDKDLKSRGELNAGEDDVSLSKFREANEERDVSSHMDYPDYQTNRFITRRRPAEVYKPAGRRRMGDESVDYDTRITKVAKPDYDEAGDIHDTRTDKDVIHDEVAESKIGESANGFFDGIWGHQPAGDLAPWPSTEPEPSRTTSSTILVVTPTSTMITLPPTKTLTPLPTQENITTAESDGNRETPEISLFEKSKLSILKKAQKKESSMKETTRKPPVLFQVKKNMHTVVMVEPPVSEPSFRRSGDRSQQSPAEILKVKQLMRQKLVADAKSIHDLTENWDELVCDYVDVSLLENSSTKQNLSHCMLSFLIWFIWDVA